MITAEDRPDNINASLWDWRWVILGIIAFVALTTLKARLLLIGTVVSKSQGDMANALLLLCLGLAVTACGDRIRRVAFLVIVVLLSLLLFADKVHYRAFHEFATVIELGHAGQLGDVFTGILPYVRIFDLFWVADWPLWFFLAARSWRKKSPQDRQRIVRIAIAGLAVGLSAYGVTIFGYLSGRTEKTLVTRRDFAVRELGILNYHLLDAIDAATTPRTRELPEPHIVERVSKLLSADQPDGPELVRFGAARGYNVIFLQVESLEAFVIGLTLNGQEVTPTLNRLTTNSHYFSRFFPQTSLGSTSDAEFCVMNSLLPARNGVVARQHLRNTFRALPAILREHGYQTVSMSVCRPNLWNMGLMHRAYGFQHRYYYDHFAKLGESPLEIPDDRFLTNARETVRRHQQPFLLHLMTISSHTPFTRFPKERRTLRLGEWEGTSVGDYLQAVHFVDSAIKQFLDGLTKDGLASNSIIVIYGDHQALPDEDWMKFKPMASDAVGSRLDEKLRRRVPAFILVPGVSPGGRIERPAGQIDIAPSVLHLLGVPRSESLFMGQNLFRETPPLVYFRTGAFLDGLQFWSASADVGSDPKCAGVLALAKVSSAGCRQTYDEVQHRIEVSDQVLEFDLIPDLVKRLPSAAR